MRRSIPLLFLLALAVAASGASAQTLISVEGHGQVGYNNVDAPGWLGIGVFEVGRVVTGGDVQVIFGRQSQRGLELGLEAGYQKLLSYNFIVGGQPTEFTADAVRLALSTRFWLDDGAWFGEASFGSYFFDGFTDPALMGGVGKLFPIGERFAIPVRIRAAAIFNGSAVILPFTIGSGINYQLIG